MTTTSVYINLPILPTKNKSLEKKRWMFYLVYGITQKKTKKKPRHILKWGYKWHFKGICSQLYKDNWPNFQQTQTPVWDLTSEGKLD